jgi:cytochrome c
MRIAYFATALAFIATSSTAYAGDPADGQRVFAQCRACHQVGETARNTVGPHLNGLFGRKAGSVEGYNYSRAFDNLDKVWDEENFAVYIRNPRQVTPGTKMVFAGLRTDKQIEDLTAYLKQFDETGATK